MHRVGAFVVLAMAVGGCEPALPAARSTPPGAGSDGQARAAAFHDIEDEVLRDLAALDRRFALRAGIEPREDDLRRVAMGAVLAEDPSLAAIDGAIDAFSFDARARGLGEVKERLRSARAKLPPGGASSSTSEEAMLERLVDEEIVRLDEERALPRSASALVRGVVETWKAPASPQEAAERDRWLARRLAEIDAAVTSPAAKPGASAPLDVGRARELDDALDALERRVEAAGLGHATAGLVRLREALEAHGSRPTILAAADWPGVARGLRAHLGLAITPEVLDARLAATAASLRTAAETAMAKAEGGGEVVLARATPLVFGGPDCALPIAASKVRSLTPPPERQAACRLSQLVAAASDPVARAAALVAMHDHVIIARWALDVARGAATLAATTGKHRPLSRPTPDIAARWERIALARPTSAIGGGIAACVLYGEGAPEERARAWASLGDVPLDVAERELH